MHRSFPARALPICVLSLVGALQSKLLHAQPTGGFTPELAPKDARILTVRDVAQFRVLMADPSLVSSNRFSAWAVRISSATSGGEAKIQLNFCDVKTIGERCKKSKLAFDLVGAGPLSKTDTVTELADLNGLVGTTRVEAGMAYNNLNAYFLPGFNLRVTVSDPRFDYRQGTALTKTSARHPLFSATANVAIKGLTSLVSVGARYENLFKSVDAQSICSPFAGGPPGTLSCESLFLGPPRQQTKTLAVLELRRAFGRIAAISPTLTFDFKKDVLGVDVPLWVIPRDTLGLGAGVRYGYRNDTKRSTIAFFVSTSVFQ